MSSPSREGFENPKLVVEHDSSGYDRPYALMIPYRRYFSSAAAEAEFFSMARTPIIIFREKKFPAFPLTDASRSTEGQPIGEKVPIGHRRLQFF